MSEKTGKKLKFAISCGGTGGHFYPGLSIAECAKGEGDDALLLLSGRNSAAQRDIADGRGVSAAVLPQLPNPKRKPFTYLSVIFAATGKCRDVMREFHPDALLCMGSFTALPAFLAAESLGIPVFLHDGNARVGRANRWMSRFARFLGTAFPAVNGECIKCPHEAVGMPLRPELLNCAKMSKAEAIGILNRKFGADFSPERNVLLVFGGSQGAEVLNRVIPEAAAAFPELQVIHLAGKGNGEKTASLYNSMAHICIDGSEEMGLFYQACDAVVSRSGGSSVSEILYFGKKALLIPYPYAAENHQYDNAAYAAKEGDAFLLENSDCTVEKVRSVLGRGDFFAPGERSAKLAKPGAAAEMLKIIRQGIGLEKVENNTEKAGAVK